jgi:hypothetical protein
MKTIEIIMDDDLRPEYDLENLEVRRIGNERKSFGKSFIHLEPDVQDVFPSSELVNEALRFLIRITKDNKQGIPELRNIA